MSFKEVKLVPLTQIHDHSIYWLGIGTSMKCDGAKQVLCAQTFRLNEGMRSCTCE